MRRKSLLAVAVSAAALAGLSAGPAFAGEVNGSTKNHKEDFAKGKSICMFSGLNDIPEGDPEEGPPGRTQSYGQDVANFGAVPQEFNPGDICNPNILPLK
jgi:hypothetical protein